jgi:hypothetical protein
LLPKGGECQKSGDGSGGVVSHLGMAGSWNGSIGSAIDLRESAGIMVHYSVRSKNFFRAAAQMGRGQGPRFQ